MASKARGRRARGHYDPSNGECQEGTHGIRSFRRGRVFYWQDRGLTREKRVSIRGKKNATARGDEYQTSDIDEDSLGRTILLTVFYGRKRGSWARRSGS